MTFISSIRFLSLATFTILLTACGGGTEKDTNYVVDESQIIITKEAGLSKSFDNNLVKLTAPANAVTNDTSFIFSKADVDEENKALEIASPLYTFAPLSLAFDKPITLTISLASPPTQDQELTIVKKVGDAWQALATSRQSQSTASAQVNSFGTFAIQAHTLPTIDKTIGPQCAANQAKQSVRFIHVADLHARFGFKEQYYSKIRKYYNDTVAEHPYTIFTNGGDDYEKGTVAEQTSMGEATLEATKAMAFDIRVIGNHDYAWGPEQLLKYADDKNAIVLASNTKYVNRDDDEFAGMDFSVIQVGCIKVGFFGMTSVPWNELDEPLDDEPIPDFIAQFKMNWKWQDIAQNIVSKYRQDVDYMVMLSHLGVGKDTRIAQNVDGIDLVLGGHTHGGESFQQLDNNSIVIQPNFYARGITDLSISFNLDDKTVKDIDYDTVTTTDVASTDSTTETAIAQIMGRFAPDANTEIAVSENYPTEAELALVTGKATQYQFPEIDAVLLDPNQVQDRWLPGTLTQEDFHSAYKVERQPSNTPGFNAVYSISVSGAQLNDMFISQPDWVSIKPDTIDPLANYNVALFKGAALNPDLFFNAMTPTQTKELAESWWILDRYARFRTSQCMYIDSDKQLSACKTDDSVTVWNFNDPAQPLNADVGQAALSYFDPEEKNWAQKEIEYKNTTELGITDLPDGPANVLSFPRFSPTEGLKITTNSPANGDYEPQGLLSDYTIVMDLFWPEESTLKKRALIQTNPTNGDDADIFIYKKEGIGISTRDSGYFGKIEANTWHRIAFVFFTAPSNGSYKAYIDGQLVGVKEDGTINDRWAVNQALLLLTDNNYEASPGYLNSLLFAAHAMTDDEIKSLAGPQRELKYTRSIRQLNQVVTRHYKAAPTVRNNPWLEQRSKFFKKKPKM